jgi:hypothetical protein
MTSLKNSLKTLTIAALATAALAASAMPSQALGRYFPVHGGHGPVVLGNHFGPGIYKCLVCSLPRPYRPLPVWGHGPRWPIFGQNHWGHWGHWDHYRWHPVSYRGGAPVGPVAAAPVAAIPGQAEAPTGACNCLTKQNLPNGSVLFQDVCTQQSAIAGPQTMSAR